MNTLIDLMKSRGLTRFINISGASAVIKGEKITSSRKIMRFIMRLTLPKVLQVKELELEILQSSPLTFTAIRPPMIEENIKGQLYTSSRAIPSMKVNANQLASFILDIIDDPTWYRKMPFVGTK